MSYEKHLEKLGYGSPLSDQGDAYEALNEELDRKSPSTMAAILGGVGGSLLGAIPAYGLGRLAGRANKFVPRVAKARYDKDRAGRLASDAARVAENPVRKAAFEASAPAYIKEGLAPPTFMPYVPPDRPSFRGWMKNNAKEAAEIDDLSSRSGFLGQLMGRNLGGWSHARSSPEQMRRFYQDVLGIGSGVAGSTIGAAVGTNLAGQAFGSDLPGAQQARETLAAIQSGRLSEQEEVAAKRKLAAHFEQTEDNRGSLALGALANLAVTLPLAAAMKHPGVAARMEKLIPNSALSSSPIVKTRLGRTALSDFGSDVALAAPLGTAAGVGAYKLTEDNEDYLNPF